LIPACELICAACHGAIMSDAPTTAPPVDLYGIPVTAPPGTPLRRCDECRHHLGEALMAFCRCPMWGRPRWNLEVRCAAFEPKSPTPP
jgi:hypothetical protein